MTLQEIVATVILNTNRDDLGFVADGGDGQIPNAVFAATQSLHIMDNWWRDITSADVMFDTSAWIQTLDVTTMPRFRAFSYFRKWDNTFNTSQQNPGILPPLFNGISTVNSLLALKELEFIDMAEVFDDYGTERQDVCYAAGGTINIKSSTPITMGKVGWYQYPFLDQANSGAGYSSWIAENHPYAIIYKAQQFIDMNVGDLEEARELVRPSNPRTMDPGGLLTQQIEMLRMSNVELVGR